MLTQKAADPALKGWPLAGAILLTALAILALSTFRHYGNGFDAQVQDTYGADILSWFRTLGADRSALRFRDLYYYGGFFDTLAALVVAHSTVPHWATRHLLEAGFGLMGLAGAWRLGTHLAGPRAGFLALAALALMPSYYGMMYINPKDIPFAAAAIWSIYVMTVMIQHLPKPPRRLVVGLGLALGALLAIRIVGVLFIVFFGFVLLIDLIQRARVEQWTAKKFASAALRQGVTLFFPVLVIAWGVMVLFWPWAQVSPILHPLEALRHFSSLANNIDTLYFGQQISTSYHPASYLPVYLTIKLPDIIVAAFVAAIGVTIAEIWRKGWQSPPLRLVPILLAAFFPIAYAVITRPELYDAERHFLFTLPPLAVLAGLTADRVLGLCKGRAIVSGAVIAVMMIGASRQIAENVDLHPYEYAYFNDLVGGTTGAKGRFETEYWGTSLAEATDDLRFYLKTHGLMRTTPWKVAISGEATQMGDEPHPHLQLTDQWNKADFYISATRRGTDRWLPGTVIKKVQRDGVAFAVVKDLRRTAHASITGTKAHG